MSILERVGRHARAGGRHCRNLVDDQQFIINLLNYISVSLGGTEGKLQFKRLVDGVCPDALYAAIVRFEDRYFPKQGSGYVDPDGMMIKEVGVGRGPGTRALPQVRFPNGFHDVG